MVFMFSHIEVRTMISIKSDDRDIHLKAQWGDGKLHVGARPR